MASPSSAAIRGTRTVSAIGIARSAHRKCKRSAIRASGMRSSARTSDSALSQRSLCSSPLGARHDRNRRHHAQPPSPPAALRRGRLAAPEKGDHHLGQRFGGRDARIPRRFRRAALPRRAPSGEHQDECLRAGDLPHPRTISSSSTTTSWRLRRAGTRPLVRSSGFPRWVTSRRTSSTIRTTPPRNTSSICARSDRLHATEIEGIAILNPTGGTADVPRLYTASAVRAGREVGVLARGCRTSGTSTASATARLFEKT